MKLYAELRIHDSHLLPDQLRKKTPRFFRLEGTTLVYPGHMSALTPSEWLKQMWPVLNSDRDWIKTALRSGANGEVYCYIKNLEEEIILAPEALALCTSLGVPLRISKRLEKPKPNQSSQRNAMARPISVFESRSSRG
jgi:hypothetical protein